MIPEPVFAAPGAVMRSPLLPFDVLRELFAGLQASALAGRDEPASEEELHAAAEADQAVLTERLRALLADPVVREAIFVASPSLDERITAWLAGDRSEERAIVRSALAYVSRAATRCTPFGLFAGCTAGEVGGETALRLRGRDEIARHTRLDYGFVAGVLRAAEQVPEVQERLTFTPNSGLYRAGGRLRLAEVRLHRGRVSYQRVAFDEDEVLTEVLDAAAGGATLEDLVTRLAKDDVSREEAAEYIGELVEAQILVSDLGPAITGPEPVPLVAEKLQAIEAARPTGAAMAKAQEAIDGFDATGGGNPPEQYRAVADDLRALDADLELGQLFQVDMVVPPEQVRLGDEVMAEVDRAIGLLHRLAPSPTANDLTAFREQFTARYEDREAPLVEVLDEEVGIGFGKGPSPIAEAGPLLAGLPNIGAHRGHGGGPEWRPSDNHRVTLLVDALAAGATEVQLSDDDVARLANPGSPPLPDAVAVMCTLVAASEDAVRSGDFQLLVRGVLGPSGARLLGRFCHADPAIETIVRQHLRAEEALAPDAVFAEVVHLSEGRIGNVLARPVLRDHEIVFLGHSGASPDRQLPVDDLLVSVTGDEVRLRSRRLGREVKPRLTSAHNFASSALAPYRFLGSVQHHGSATGMMWSWGPLESRPFLPRVTAGRLILSRARWAVVGDEIAALSKAKSVPQRFAAVQRLRRERNLPRWVAVAVGDNELAMDLDTFAGCDSLAHEAKKTGSLRLLELVPAADELCVDTPHGRVFHELVIPLARRATPADAAPPRRVTRPLPRPDVEVEETFAPGSAWLTAKLYTGKATADAVLRDLLAPFVERCLVEGTIDRWFFLRYGDPDWHLRVRFHGAPEVLSGQVLPALNEAARQLLDDARVWRLQLDTYRRETFRYGGPLGIERCEAIFGADSDAVLATMAALPAEDDGDLRWRAAVLGVDRLLEDLGFDLEQRRQLVLGWRDRFAEEFGSQGVAAKRLAGRVFRTDRTTLAALLDGTPADVALVPVVAAFADRSERIRPIAAELAALDDEGVLDQSLAGIAGSLCHMHVNRMLRATQRIQEQVVYDLLDRLYRARMHHRP